MTSIHHILNVFLCLYLVSSWYFSEIRYLSLSIVPVSFSVPHMISLYNIILMSSVEGWIAATKPTMTPGTPIYLGENPLLMTLQFLRTK